MDPWFGMQLMCRLGFVPCFAVLGWLLSGWPILNGPADSESMARAAKTEGRWLIGGAAVGCAVAILL